MQGTLAGEYVRTQGTLVLEYVSLQDTLACEQVSKQGTFVPPFFAQRRTKSNLGNFTSQIHPKYL